jgi:hypothetical protein
MERLRDENVHYRYTFIIHYYGIHPLSVHYKVSPDNVQYLYLVSDCHKNIMYFLTYMYSLTYERRQFFL